MALELTIVTPQGTRYRGPVEQVVLPGSEGDFGVLERHERFLAPLRIGEARIETGSETLYASIADGFADVSAEEVVVLVESCELAHEIDTARAELAHTRAEQHLAELGKTENDKRREEFEEALERARNRLAVSEKARAG